MGSLQGGMGVHPTVGFKRHHVGSLAGSMSECHKGAPMAMGFGAVELWRGEEFIVWAGVG